MIKDTNKFLRRIHLRVCFDGEYHLLGESTHYNSDMSPSAKQIWEPPTRILKLGILRGSGFYLRRPKIVVALHMLMWSPTMGKNV